MQVTNHAGHGPRRGTPTAHRDGPLRSPLEQAPPRSRAHSPSGRLRPVRGATLPSKRSRPARGITPPRAGLVSLEGSSRPRLGPATITGAPHACASPRTRAFNALTPRDGAIMRPGLAPRCRRTNSPGRRPSPPLWEGTVRYGRCQSRDTARPLQYG
jgi:hypothetical protein